MPYWWWLDQDGCWFCKRKNNCNQCKAARAFSKHKLPSRRDRRQKEKVHEQND